jgi:hypothetical protein
MLLIKCIAIVLAAVAITKTYLDYRKRLEPLLMFVFWTVVWISATVVIVFPGLIYQLIDYSQDRSVTIGALTGLAFIFMLYIVYRVYAKVARVEYQFTELVRKITLAEKDKGKKK